VRVCACVHVCVCVCARACMLRLTPPSPRFPTYPPTAPSCSGSPLVFIHPSCSAAVVQRSHRPAPRNPAPQMNPGTPPGLLPLLRLPQTATRRCAAGARMATLNQSMPPPPPPHLAMLRQRMRTQRQAARRRLVPQRSNLHGRLERDGHFKKEK
jgi:hypothetical protein